MAHYVGNDRDGQRAARGAKTRDDQAEGFNKIKKKLRAETEAQIERLGDKFAESDTVSEQLFKSAVMGLQTNQEYTRKEQMFMRDGGMADFNEPEKEIVVSENKKRTQKRIKKQAALSFDADEEDGDEFLAPLPKKRRKDKGVSMKNPSIASKRCVKNPNIDTSFLPDAERDKVDEELREKFRAEWKEEQEQIKGQPLEVTYAYWDGSGHRRTTTVRKGTTIEEFLEGARKTLAPHFSDLRGLHGSHLMYIKDELIIPHSYSFYDLLVTNATGPEGLLFKLEPYENLDRDCAKPGKVITRAWYERNKHIYPASRWDTYDPSIHSSE